MGNLLERFISNFKTRKNPPAPPDFYWFEEPDHIPEVKDEYLIGAIPQKCELKQAIITPKDEGDVYIYDPILIDILENSENSSETLLASHS